MLLLLRDIRTQLRESTSLPARALPALLQAQVHGTDRNIFHAGKAAAARWKEAIVLRDNLGNIVPAEEVYGSSLFPGGFPSSFQDAYQLSYRQLASSRLWLPDQREVHIEISNRVRMMKQER